VKQLEFRIYYLSGNRLLLKGINELISVLSIFLLSLVKFGLDLPIKLFRTCAIFVKIGAVEFVLYSGGVNEGRSFHIPCTIWLKFGIRICTSCC